MLLLDIPNRKRWTMPREARRSYAEHIPSPNEKPWKTRRSASSNQSETDKGSPVSEACSTFVLTLCWYAPNSGHARNVLTGISSENHVGKGDGVSMTKALLINGSPQQKKSTFTALEQVARGLEDNGVSTEIVWLGNQPVKPCVACGACNATQRCAFGEEDGVNALIEAVQAADALVIGSPVHFAGMNGSLKSALDRMFFAAASSFACKPAGVVVVARRAGTTAALDQILKYPLYAQMPVVSSFYWTMLHGQNGEQVLKDEEGVQCAYQLGANMAWLLASIAAGREAGIAPTKLENRAWTNFIR